jgi:Uma2 family endonuclease
MVNIIETAILDFELEDELEDNTVEDGEGIRADGVAGARQGEWTYQKYLVIPEDGNRYEVINGVLYQMASPNHKHQKAVLRIAHYLFTYVDAVKLGEVLLSPFDVVLPSGTTVQPDVSVVLNRNKRIVKAKRAMGTPDLVVEVASPSTGGYDKNLKRASYAQASVKEFWIVSPRQKTVELFVLENGDLISKGVFKGQATIPSTVVLDFPVTVEQFFA